MDRHNKGFTAESMQSPYNGISLCIVIRMYMMGGMGAMNMGGGY